MHARIIPDWTASGLLLLVLLLVAAASLLSLLADLAMRFIMPVG
jgi:hypothetical protein